MKDMHAQMTRAVAIGNAVLAATTTPAAIDLQGYDAAEIMLDIGIGGITFTGVNKIDFTLTHSDDNSTYSSVADADMLGVAGITGGIIKSLQAAHAAAAVYRYGYIGSKRYLKLAAVFSGVHGVGTPIAASVSELRSRLMPTANQA